MVPAQATAAMAPVEATAALGADCSLGCEHERLPDEQRVRVMDPTAPTVVQEATAAMAAAVAMAAVVAMAATVATVAMAA